MTSEVYAVPMNREPKDVGELWTLISLQFSNLQTQVADMNARMDGMVSRGIFEAAQTRNTERLVEVEKDIAESRSDSRAVIAEMKASVARDSAEMKAAVAKNEAAAARNFEKINERITQTLRVAFTSLIGPIIVAVVVAFILTKGA